MSAISIKSFTKNYPTGRGIENISLEVEPGELYGFIGPNGAGKSTTIKLLLNFIYPTSGSAQILGQDVVSGSAKIKEKTGYVPSEVRFYGNMTADSLLQTTLSFHNKKNTGELNRLCELFEVDKDKKLAELSLGNKKKVAIVSALIFDPELIILDEPTGGLDPLMQKRLFEVLKERTKNGTTVFLSSHILTEVQEYCSKVAFIKEGKIIEVQDLSTKQNNSKILTIWGAAELDCFLKIGARKLDASDGKTALLYEGDLNILAKAIFDSNAKNYTVENPSLESKFLSYYEGGHRE